MPALQIRAVNGTRFLDRIKMQAIQAKPSPSVNCNFSSYNGSSFNHGVQTRTFGLLTSLDRDYNSVNSTALL
jgi:hypothetical protein